MSVTYPFDSEMLHQLVFVRAVMEQLRHWHLDQARGWRLLLLDWLVRLKVDAPEAIGGRGRSCSHLDDVREVLGVVGGCDDVGLVSRLVLLLFTALLVVARSGSCLLLHFLVAHS